MNNAINLQTVLKSGTVKYEMGTYNNIFNKWCDYYSEHLKELWELINNQNELTIICDYPEFCKYIFDKSPKCLKKTYI